MHGTTSGVPARIMNDHDPPRLERSKTRPMAEVLRHYAPGDMEPQEFVRTSDDLLAQFPPPPMLRRFKPPTHKPRRPAMRVESVYAVVGRGIGVSVRLAGPAPSLDQHWLVHRPRDGASWKLKAIEKFCINRDLAVGDRIGLLVPLGVPISEGDVIEFVEEAANP